MTAVLSPHQQEISKRLAKYNLNLSFREKTNPLKMINRYWKKMTDIDRKEPSKQVERSGKNLDELVCTN
jgi:hypothetical protein